GAAAEAACDLAHSDRKTACHIADALETTAACIEVGYWNIQGNLDAARNQLATAEENGFIVTEDLQVQDTNTDATAEREVLRSGLQDDLRRYAAATAEADRALSRQLDDARTDLRLAFTSAAALGDVQAHADGRDLAAGTVDAETLHRIAAAGTLTDDQLAQVRAGLPAEIPASQMEYLNTLARSLDGMSPQELTDLMSTLPAPARAGLANSLQLISTDTVTVATVSGFNVPAHGGVELLPDGIRETLSREDRVVYSWTEVHGRLFSVTELHGVADTQAVAQIVAAGDSEFRVGSALDRGLLEAGREYLGVEVAREQVPVSERGFFMVDGKGPEAGYLEPIFAAISDDHVVVEQVVTGEHGGDFIHDVLTHEWSDESAVMPMFAFDEWESVVQDPADPADVAEATRSGRVMSAVAEAMSSDDAWTRLSNIPGTDHRSIGEVNPDLVRTVAHSMTPYIPRLVSIELEDRPGFDIEGWTDPSNNNTYRGSVNVFATMNTDEAAGTYFSRQVLAEIAAAEIRYGENPDVALSTRHLSDAGRLLGILDEGIEHAIQDDYNDDYARDRAVYDRKANAYNAITWMGGHIIPGSDIVFDTISAGGNPLQDAVIGPPPESAKTAVIDEIVPEYQHYIALAAMSDIPEELRVKYAEILFDDNGDLMNFAELLPGDSEKEDRSKMEAAVREVFANVGSDDGHETALADAYRAVRQ
ncbi:hypothetical protein, partial [Rhodococcus yananensis]